MKEILVSVCINAYNAEKYIRRTIDSVINQTYKNLQIIVVDDCSTDNTYDVVKAIDDARIEVYKTPFNGHMSFACNAALKYVKGDYVAHLDADDLWVEDKIEKQVAFLEENHEYGACFTHAEIIDESGSIADTKYDPQRAAFAFENRTHAAMYRFFYDCLNRLCHSSALIRTNIINIVGKYNVSTLYLQDFDYWMRLITVSPIYILPERLVLYRVSDNNSVQLSEEQLKAHNTESARIFYNSIDICPDDLFLEAFKDKLRFSGDHTHEDVELEKAFLLLEGTFAFKNNPVLGLYKFSKLFAEENYVTLAKQNFNFTTRDLYKIQARESYFDPIKNAELLNNLFEAAETNKNLNEDKKILTQNNWKLSEDNKKLGEDNRTKDQKIQGLLNELDQLRVIYNELNVNYIRLNDSYVEIKNSFFWRATKPFRMLSQKMKDIIIKRRRLLIAAIYMKGFLRGGFKGGKNQVKSYLAFIEYHPVLKVANPPKNLSIISRNTRKQQQSFKFSKDIKFSILVPLYNTPKSFLIEMINSVRNQTYSNWELCLADGSTEEFSYVEKLCKRLAAKDKRIVYKKLEKNLGISENTNACIEMATGNFIALFDHDDVLHPSALFECMKQICEKDADYVYTDEATFLGNDITDIITFHFKPDFSYYNLLANNYICHLSVFDAKLLNKAGLFRHDYDGSQDHDMILRLTSVAKNVVHIPKLLYFWRSHANSVAMDINSKTYAIKAGQRAVRDFLLTKGVEADVMSSPAFPTIYRFKYEIKDTPLVSIIIPNKNHYDDLKRCIESIEKLTTYPNYEIIIVDNQSSKCDIKEYYTELEKDVKIKILSYDFPFNYSAINNYAVSQCNGEYLLLLNNDTKVITPEWIEELLMYAQQDAVGAVGAKLYYPNNTVQHGGVILGLGKDKIAGHAHHRVNSDNLGYMGKLFYTQNISAVTAACLMVKRSKFHEVDGFDEEQAVAYNDVDFCLKLDESGYQNIFNPFCELYHYESISRGLDTSKENIARFKREVKYFKKKWSHKLEAGDKYYNPNFSLDCSYEINKFGR